MRRVSRKRGQSMSKADGSAPGALKQVWQSFGLPGDALARVTFGPSEGLVPSSFMVGVAAQVSVAASALMAALLHEMKTGARQGVHVDGRHALAEFRSERYARLDGRPLPDLWDAIAGAYRCGDGRWVRIHTNFAHHRDGILDLLGCGHDKGAVAERLLNWDAEAFEREASERGLVVAMMRSFEEWEAHPQGQAIAQQPLLDLTRLGDAAAVPLPVGERPLAGVRVLDLTRIIAGPVCGRTLAAHGADVLYVSAPHLPAIESLVIDTGRGKRACQLDLRMAGDRRAFEALLSRTDILLQAYRPGALAALGFGPAELADRYPGLIYASLSAYGTTGPWALRRGFDSLVQTATGFNDAEARAKGSNAPVPLPAQVLDHAAGYLLASGIMVALSRRAREGGNWQVETSLAQVGHWVRHLGRVDGGMLVLEQRLEDIHDLLEINVTPFGVLQSVRHAGILSVTPAYWALPTVPLGSHPACWA